MPLVSVTMASFNHERYVRAALESVLAQTFQDFEIIVTDDGSSDRTADVIQSLKDSRISLRVFPRNSGACVAMNASIGKASGRYIAILNSDDIFAPTKLAKQVAYLEANTNVGAVFAYPAFIGDDGGPLQNDATFYRDTFYVKNRSRAQWLRHFFFHENVLCHPSVLIRRKCYETIGLYDPCLAQLPDLDLWIRLLRTVPIHIIEEPLVGFRILASGQNASAPRPEVIVRLQWERLQTLRHYADLGSDLLSEVFPEIPRLPSRQRKYPSRLTRLAGKTLSRFLGDVGRNLPDTQSPATSAQSAQAWLVGRLAISTGKPAHTLFGLDLMRASLSSSQDDPRYREFIAATGSNDVFSVLRKV